MFDSLNKRCGHVVPSSPVEFTPRFTFDGATPLFEKERNSCSVTPIADLTYPRDINGTGARPGLTTDYHPVNTLERKPRNWTDERLDGQKSNERIRFLKRINTVCDGRILNARSHPNMAIPR